MFRLVKTVALILGRGAEPSIIRFIVEFIGHRIDILADTFLGMENWKPLYTFLESPKLEEGCLMMLRHHGSGKTRIAFLEAEAGEDAYARPIFDETRDCWFESANELKYYYVCDSRPKKLTSDKGDQYPVWFFKQTKRLNRHEKIFFSRKYCDLDDMYGVVIDEDRKYVYVPRLIRDTFDNRVSALLDIVGYDP